MYFIILVIFVIINCVRHVRYTTMLKSAIYRSVFSPNSTVQFKVCFSAQFKVCFSLVLFWLILFYDRSSIALKKFAFIVLRVCQKLNGFSSLSLFPDIIDNFSPQHTLHILQLAYNAVAAIANSFLPLAKKKI